jgi:tetratricopeptide (TPR) repeat protein
MSDPKSLSAKYKIPSPPALSAADTIVIVEDQTDLRLIVSHQLSKLSLGTCRQAGNGYEAIELIKTQKLQVAAYVCDMDMPVMNGLDFLTELRESGELDRAPFCLTMDNVNKEKIRLAVENGVDEILVKPFTLGDIGPKLRAAFTKFHNPNNPERVYELAKQSLRDEKLDVAETIYKDLAANAPKAARPVVGLARIEVKRNNPEKALQLLTEAEGKNKNYVHLYTQRAMIYAAKSDWSTAIENFKKAIELSPLNAVRYKEAADLLFKVKRYDEACELLETAIKHKLEFPDLYAYLSQAKFALRDYKLAQKYVRQALQSDAENVTYLNQLGICLKETQQMDEAVKVYNQVIKLDPANTDALYNKAVLLNTKGETEEAIKLLERILKKIPDHEVAKAKLEQYNKELAEKKKPGAA